MNFDKILTRFSHFLSAVLSPLLMPAYGVFLALWVSILCYIPFGTRLAVLLVVFGITCIIPVVFITILHSTKVISDPGLNKREERWLPYLFIIACYVGAAFYLRHVHSPVWLSAFVWGGVAAALVAFLINFRWKISAHLSGIGGLVGLLFWIQQMGLEAFNLKILICVSILLAGLLGTARLVLERHTLGQVIAGFFNGFLWVLIVMTLLG